MEQVKTQSDLKITDLPDDCLIKIFNFISMTDLLAMYKTHSQFESPAIKSFSNNFKHLQLEPISGNKAYLYPQYKRTFCSISSFKNYGAEIFEVFGSAIQSLKIMSMCWHKIDTTEILSILNEHNSPHFKCLHLSGVTIDDTKIASLRNVFRYLEEFRVEKSLSNTALERCINSCNNLKSLSVIGRKNIYHSMLPRHCPQLEKIFYASRRNKLKLTNLGEFLQRCSNLKFIKIRKMFTPTMECLKYLENVEMLSVDLRSVNLEDLKQVDFKDLLQLRSLKRLELFSYENIAVAIKQGERVNTNIEELALNIWSMDDACCILNAFTYTNLKKLSIAYLSENVWGNDNFTSAVIEGFSQNLDNLEEIQLSNFSEQFENLILFVKYARHVKRLILLPKKRGIAFSVQQIVCIHQAQRPKQTQLTIIYDDLLEMVASPDKLNYFWDFKAATSILKFEQLQNRRRVRHFTIDA